MKIAVRGGHCPKVPGARGIIDELTEDRKVKEAVVKYLKQLNHDVLDVTPPNSISTSSEDLYYGVNKANNWGADLFVSIHFNKAYNYYNGAIGSEVCVYSNFDIAQRVINALGNLGFKNRGQKIRVALYELRRTAMKSMIVEVCFVEATKDVELYNKLGPDKIGKTIAEAVANKSTNGSAIEVPATNNESISNSGDDWVRRLQEECNKQGFSNQSVDGIPGPNTLKGCPIIKEGARGNITKLLQEKLVSLGYTTNIIDGIFGSRTKAAVIAFQKSKGLSTDGIVGENTWRKLLNM